MAIDGWTLGLQAINVIVLIWILSRFLFRPVADIIKARQAAAQKLLDEAAHARADAEDARAAAQAEKQRQTEARDARVRKRRLRPNLRRAPSWRLRAPRPLRWCRTRAPIASD